MNETINFWNELCVGALYDDEVDFHIILESRLQGLYTTTKPRTHIVKHETTTTMFRNHNRWHFFECVPKYLHKCTKYYVCHWEHSHNMIRMLCWNSNLTVLLSVGREWCGNGGKVSCLEKEERYKMVKHQAPAETILVMLAGASMTAQRATWYAEELLDLSLDWVRSWTSGRMREHWTQATTLLEILWDGGISYYAVDLCC